MAISYISGSNENINGGTIVNLGKDIDNNKNFTSSTSSRDSIGSTVIDNSHIDAADPNGVFVYNNSRPISKLYTKSLSGIDKSVNGQKILINNNAKIIRSSLAAKAIREGLFNIYTGKFEVGPENDMYNLCPDNSNGLCYQIAPPNVLPSIPFVSNNGQFEQQGAYLRFRSVGNVGKLYEPEWRTTYVPTTAMSGVAVGNDTVNVVDLEQVLPNGEYEIEYDTAVNNNLEDIARIRIKQKVNNSVVSAIYLINFSDIPILPSLEFDPDGDGIGNYGTGAEFERNFKNVENMNNLFADIMGSGYIVPTIELANVEGKPGAGELIIPRVLTTTDSNGNTQYENFYATISISTTDAIVTRIDFAITSQIPRNNTQTAFVASTEG